MNNKYRFLVENQNYDHLIVLYATERLDHHPQNTYSNLTVDQSNLLNHYIELYGELRVEQLENND